jgi:23S rRNA-/tRNA-specific pseudouridylate synthase
MDHTSEYSMNNPSKKDTPDGPSPPTKKRGMKPRSKRNRKRPRSERHAFDDEEMARTLNVLPLELDGQSIQANTPWIRTVEPYPYTFSTFTKSRWVGRTVLDVYRTEFGSYPESYYECAIAQGRILVSDQVVSADHVLKGNDVLTHTVHRHEPGVAVSLKEEPFVQIIQETKDILVVDKPGTLPVHPCGGYHVQSLMNLLEPTFGKLYTIHRLDRLTGGLVILGKTSAIATEWGKAIMNRDCKKVYLARVKGKFPLNVPDNIPLFQEESEVPENGEVKAALSHSDPGISKGNDTVKAARKRNAYGCWITHGDGALANDVSLRDIFHSKFSEDDWLADRSYKQNMKWLHLACPTRIAQPKDGICEAGRFEELDDNLYMGTVKAAETSFGVVRYDEDSDTTILVCRPETGRTHQIRLHLQHLGHSIANDPNYGGDIWYHNKAGQEACCIAQARLNEIAVINQVASTKTLPPGNAQATSTTALPATECEIRKGVSEAVRHDDEAIHEFIKRTCVWCARSQNTTGETPRDILEFLVRSPGIWLHALQYTFQDAEGKHSFRCPCPVWAREKP